MSDKTRCHGRSISYDILQQNKGSTIILYFRAEINGTRCFDVEAS